jgi:hypothetical protein
VDKPQTHHGNLYALPQALLPLTKHARWVGWCWEWRANKDGSGKWTKVPHVSWDPGRMAKSNDPTTWGSYEETLKAYEDREVDGIGYMLLGSDVAALDLDHCIDCENTDQWAVQLQREASTAYQEVTVSGTGLRIIGASDKETPRPKLDRRFAINRKTNAGIELYRNTARYITISGKQFGACEKLPPIDDFLDALFDRYSKGSREPSSEFDFNDAGRQDAPDYDSIIRNGVPEGQRSEAFQSVVWHLAGQGWTVEQITDELAKYPAGIGAKYGDRLFEEISRSYGKWFAQKRANVTGEPSPPGSNEPWPQIRVVGGELPRIVNEAEDALLKLNRDIYQRGLGIIEPVMSRLKAADDRETRAWQIVTVTNPVMVDTLSCAAGFLRYNARSKSWVSIDPPSQVAEIYLARKGKWKLPVLTSVINVPFLRRDGTICEKPGYDEETGLLYKPESMFPPIPLYPTKDDAVRALEFITNQVLGEFPFVGDTDRSVAQAAILTGLDRHNMPTAPATGLTAPTAGTGKSKLVDICSVIIAGRIAPAIGQGKDENELESRLGARLLGGAPITSIDNCEHEVRSVFLCQMLTQQNVPIRIFGKKQDTQTSPCATNVFMNGNNLVVGGDLPRRVLMCSLDARCEHPERRVFKQDALEVAKARRVELVVAGLTILRAWHLAGEKDTKPCIGSFEEWSHRIRELLIWLGRPDPSETILEVKAADPRMLALEAVMSQWQEHLGTDQAYSIKEIIDRACVITEFFQALMAVAKTNNGAAVSNDRLGSWLNRIKGKIAGEMRLEFAGISRGYRKWKLTKLS